MPAARLVTSEMPKTSMPAWRAAMASSAVDMPTRSAPMHLGVAHLGGGLVVRAGELRVHALIQGRVHLAGQGADARGVQVGQVHERRTLQRRGGGEVDVVG